MTYTTPEGVTIGTFTADTLPASFRAPAGAGISYKIYGTEAGVGTATSEGEPAGYKITLTVDDTPVPIYIGESKLGAAEYVDFLAQKIYREKANLVAAAIPNASVNSSSILTTNDTLNSAVTPVEQGKTYTIVYARGASSSNMICGVFENYPEIGSTTYNSTRFVWGGEYYTFTAPIDGYLVSSYALAVTNPIVYEGSYPRVAPTDPPAPLPTITAAAETIITTADTIGSIVLSGDWSAIMGSTQAESIDIGFTVDADSFIAMLTVDDDPSIQVFDTFTIPSTADSFTLQVVSWGREQYTETVYSALF